MDSLTALRDAINRLGGPTAAAELLGVSQPRVSNWLWRGSIPPDQAARLAAIQAAEVAASDLRPDVFGSPEPGDDAAA